MDNKKAYQQFCKDNSHLPIFAMDWYLDAVCQDGKWDVVLLEEEGKTIAAHPYFLKKKGPFKYITMPHLCKYMGPFYADHIKAVEQKSQINQQLIKLLPKVDHVNQNFHYEVLDVDVFVTNNFTCKECYSYRIEDLSDLEQVLKNFNSDYRNNKIKRAKSIVTIHHDLSIEEFYKVNKMSFDRQEIAVPYSLPFLKKLDKVLAEKNQRKIFYAKDIDNNIHSVVYLIWDNATAYYHIAGDDPVLRKSGSGILLVWEVIQYTKNVLGLNIFDFEGSMIPPIERVRKKFGASKKEYFNVTQYRSKAFEMLANLRS